MVKVSLTKGERVVLYRRSLGLSQSQFGKRYKVDRNTIGRVENDKADLDIKNLPEYKAITELQMCFIKRKRANMSQATCAAKLNVSRFWFNQMEMGRVKNELLLEYWK